MSYDHFKFSGHFDPESRTWRGRSYVIHTKIYIRWYSQYLRRITYVVMMYIHHILFFPVFAKLTTDEVYNPRFYVGFYPNPHWLAKITTEKVYNPRFDLGLEPDRKWPSKSDETLGQVDYTTRRWGNGRVWRSSVLRPNYIGNCSTVLSENRTGT